MSTPQHDEAQHPRSRSGKWTAKTVEEAFAGMDAINVTVTPAQTQIGVKESAAAMRSDLRELFGHPFSVRMARGTAYGWADVSWEDGPRTAQVDDKTWAYRSQNFDGQDDSYHQVNQDAPVRYSLSGIISQRHIGPRGQAFVDAIFDQAGVTGYQRMDTKTGERSDYSGGYSWNGIMAAEDIARVERHVGEPIPGVVLSNAPSIGEIAAYLHACTDFTADQPAVDFGRI